LRTSTAIDGLPSWSTPSLIEVFIQDFLLDKKLDCVLGPFLATNESLAWINAFENKLFASVTGRTKYTHNPEKKIRQANENPHLNTTQIHDGANKQKERRLTELSIHHKMGNTNTKTRTTVTDEKDLVPLPFYASPETLPATLPSCDEIEAASSSETLLVDTSSRKVVRVGKFIVKYGAGVDFLEGQTLLFLQCNRSRLPSLIIPRVYAMLTKGRSNYIIMECLEGWSTLHNVWQKLTTPEKLGVAKNLRKAIEEMRSLPSPTGGYCSVGPCPIPYNFFWKPADQKQISGPFQTEEEWNRAMIEAISSDGGRPFLSEFLGRSLTCVLKGHAPVFTHGDLQRKNIMITKEVNPLDPNSFEYQVSLVDWEFAGWYPSYWEYYSAMLSNRMDDDWSNYLDTAILDPYYNEWYVCRTLHKELFGY
jgi:hypothetical protein